MAESKTGAPGVHANKKVSAPLASAAPVSGVVQTPLATNGSSSAMKLATPETLNPALELKPALASIAHDAPLAHDALATVPPVTTPSSPTLPSTTMPSTTMPSTTMPSTTMDSTDNAIASYTSDDGRKSLRLMAELFAKNEMTPDTFRGKVGNCMIACELAVRTNESPLLIMQNMNIIHGKLGWSAKYLIGKFNKCGRFTNMQFEFTGTEDTPDWGCRAFATDIASGKTVKGAKVTMKMAKAEGWIDKNGSKWKTMPEHMLMYRAGTFLQSTHAPELSLGLPTTDELMDSGPRQNGEQSAKQLSNLVLNKQLPQAPLSQAPLSDTSNEAIAIEDVALRAPAEIALDHLLDRLVDLGIPVSEAENLLGVMKEDWNESAIAELGEACTKIESGMTTKEEIFG